MRARFTRKDYLELPEGFPAELIAGTLVKEPSPTYGHRGLVVEIVAVLLRVVPKDRVRPGPVDAPIDDYNVYIPDVAVFRTKPPDSEGGTLVPLVTFEIASPSTRRRDRAIKTRGYLAAGVEEVWIVDREARTVDVHRADGVERTEGRESARSTAIPGFALVPEELFGPRPA